MWPEVMADWDERGVVIYQAFEDRIVEAAVEAQTFVPGSGFSLTRMTWIKPSFAWMLYRSGYATKRSQTRIARVRLTHDGFLEILRGAAPTHWDRGLYATRQEWGAALVQSSARYQWDPERDLRLRKTGERALQVGIQGELVRRYVEEWIVSVEDVTGLARALDGAIRAGHPLPEAFVERVYEVPADVARQLGMRQTQQDWDAGRAETEQERTE
jgi:hypothetical protein